MRLDELGVGHIDAAYEQLRQPKPRPPRPRKRAPKPSAAHVVRKDGTPRLGPGELRGQVKAVYIEIGGCGHFGFVEEPETVEVALTEFFALAG